MIWPGLDLIAWPKPDGNGSMHPEIKGLKAGKTYVVSAWVLRCQVQRRPPLHATPEWQLLKRSKVISPSLTLRLYLFRKGGSGSIYWEDVSVGVQQ